MNTLKNVLFFGLLLAVLCGVYLSLNRSPEPTLPPGLSGGHDAAEGRDARSDQAPPLRMSRPARNPAALPVFLPSRRR